MKALLTLFLLILSIPLLAIDTMNRESYVANLIRDGKKEILQKYLKKYPTHANGLTFTYEESEIVYSMLLFATGLNQTEIAKLLLNLGADPNAGDYSDFTPLMVATLRNNQEVIRFLVKYKADKNLEDMEGKTAFDYAVEENKVEEAELVKVSKKK